MMSIRARASLVARSAAVRAPHAPRCYPSQDHLRRGASQPVGDLQSQRRVAVATLRGDDVGVDLEQSARQEQKTISSAHAASLVRLCPIIDSCL